MPKKSNTSIPLFCNLCPKNPRFSDVSHLLTHISSKSHLSNRFKLQIRSQSEAEPRKLLAEFDDWYKNNGIEDLLSERLSSKEQKKTARRSRTSSAAVSVNLIAMVMALIISLVNPTLQDKGWDKDKWRVRAATSSDSVIPPSCSSHVYLVNRIFCHRFYPTASS